MHSDARRQQKFSASLRLGAFAFIFLSDGLVNSFRLAPDLAPIFFAHVFVDLDGCAAAIERVTAAALGAGDSVILACLDAVVVGLEAATFQARKVRPP